MLNRSFNGPDRGASMSPSLSQSQKHQQPRGRTLGAVIKEKDEELALFLEMRKREKERQSSLLLNNNCADELDHLPDSKPGSSPIFKITSSASTKRTGAEDFLNSDNNKNDYDWLLTPPGTPLFPSLEKEVHRSPVGHTGTPKTRPTALRSRLADPQELAARASAVSRQGIGSSGMGMGPGGIRRPSSSGGPGPGSARPSTPTGRLTQSAVSRPARSSTPTSRLTTNSSTKPMATMVTGLAARRSSTPTSRSSSLSSSVPSNGSSGRPFLPARSSTPTRRASAGAALTGMPMRTSVPSSTSSSSSSSSAVAVTGTSTSRSTGPAPVTGKKGMSPSLVRKESPTLRSRPWKPSEMPGFSLDVPPNLRTTLPERPSSASRGRPGVSRSASVDTGGSMPGAGVPRGRRQSCSPSRGRIPVPNGTAATLSAMKVRNRSSVNGGEEDGISPVLIGSKMVERVVNLRRLAPPKRDERGSPSSSSSSSRSGAPAGGKPSSAPLESSGFGRNLSKKSLDMAMRHMDIRRSIPSSLRPLMTNVPASSMYSVRSGVTGRSRGLAGVADSPLATSSNASSSELSLGNPRCLYASSEADEDAKDAAGRSPVSSFSAAPAT